jgi:hypothetical protein
VEKSAPAPRTTVSPNRSTDHAWTDGSFRKSADLGWVTTDDDQGAGPVLAQGSRTLRGKQVAFDAEITAI